MTLIHSVSKPLYSSAASDVSKGQDLDLDYLRHWSLWLDLRIIARTVILVFKDVQAY